MSSPIPPVAVTFTAQGDDAVVRAAKRVQEQLGRTASSSERSAKSVAGFADAIGNLAVALSVSKLASFAKHAIDAGDAIFKLSQKTGVSTEALSVLAFAGKTADLSIEELGGSLKFLSKSLGGLERGESSTVAAFKAIGLSARDLKGLSLDQALRKIADAQANFADGSGKAEMALRIFGREGQQVIPLLNDLANGGFDRAADAAKRLGLVWGRDAAKSAQDFNDSVAVLRGSAEGLAGQLAKEVTPGLTKAIQGTSSAIAELPDVAKSGVSNLVAIESGILGVAAAAQLLKRIGIGAALASPWGRAALAIGAIASVLLAFGRSADEAKTKYQGFLDSLNNTKDIDAERDRLEAQLAQNRADMDATSSTFKRLALLKQRQTIEERLDALARRRNNVAADVDKPDVSIPDPAVIEAQLAARKAAIDRSLQLDLARNKREDEINKSQFDQGLENYRLYFERRIGLIREGMDREIQALQAQRKVVEQRPFNGSADAVKQRDDLQKIDNDITVKRIEGEGRIDAAIQERMQLERDLATQRLQAEQQIQELQGKTFQAALTGVEIQAKQFGEAIAKQPGTGADHDAAVARLREILTLRAQAAEVERRVGVEMAAMDRDRQRTKNLVDTGKMRPLEGAEEIARLERQRLPTLQRLADEATRLANAVGDQALVDQAKALGVQLETIAASADIAGQRMARFKADAEGAVGESIQGLLTDGIAKLGDVTTTVEPVIDKAGNIVKDRFGNTVEKVTSDVYDLGDAFVDTARRIVQSIQQIAAQNLANSLAGGLFKLLGAGVKFEPLVFATGGVVPGSGTGDTVPAMLTPGEFVINKRATAQHFGLLAEINQGIYPARPVSYGRQHFASGGLVTSNEGGTATVVLEAPDGWNGRVRSDDDTVRVIVRNRRQIRDIIGGKG